MDRQELGKTSAARIYAQALQCERGAKPVRPALLVRNALRSSSREATQATSSTIVRVLVGSKMWRKT